MSYCVATTVTLVLDYHLRWKFRALDQTKCTQVLWILNWSKLILGAQIICFLFNLNYIEITSRNMRGSNFYYIICQIFKTVPSKQKYVQIDISLNYKFVKITISSAYYLIGNLFTS